MYPGKVVRLHGALFRAEGRSQIPEEVRPIREHVDWFG
jgi:hypothetical protein